MEKDDRKEISIEELIQRITNAQDGMGANNPNRILLEQCRVAIIYLAERVPQQMLKQRSGLILP